MTLQEVLFERLRHRYERVCDDEVPFRSTDVDQALRYMRQRLSDCEGNGAQTRH